VIRNKIQQSLSKSDVVSYTSPPQCVIKLDSKYDVISITLTRNMGAYHSNTGFAVRSQFSVWMYSRTGQAA